MKKAMALLFMIVLALPVTAAGEGLSVPTDSFIERAGIEADAATRERIESFLAERYISERVLGMIDDGLLAKYARHLAEDLPISYPALTESPSTPMPEGASPLQLAVLQPDGAATECLLADFERGVVYYDEAAPLTDDVCLAQYAGRLSASDGEGLVALLGGLTLEDQIGQGAGVELGAIRLAVAWEGGVTRCSAMGEGVSDEFLQGVRALLDAGRAAAQGDNL